MAFGLSFGTFERLDRGLYRVSLKEGFAAARFATGIEKLAIEVLFFLLTTEGSCRDPLVGTQLRALVGRLGAGRDEAELATQIAHEVFKAESRLKARQVNLPPDETLLRLVLAGVDVERDTSTVGMRLIIVNQEDEAVGLVIEDET